MNEMRPDSVSKKLVKFDSIPEDVALAIAAQVKRFAAMQGSLKEKEKARKARDSTLWSAALSCRANFSIYFPHLLQNVTVNSFQVISFAHWLAKGGDGSLVRFFCIQDGYGTRTRDVFASTIQRVSNLPFYHPPDDRHREGLFHISKTVYARLPKLETLHIQFPPLIFEFRSRPHLFISSLKKLSIMRAKTGHDNLSARNVLWILLFVPKLEEAALSFELSVYDFKVLVDSADWFKGLSNVNKLALTFRTIYDESDRKSWWNRPQEVSQKWEGGNKKGTAILNLLRCTKELQAFELSSHQGIFTAQDTSLLFSNCLLGLERSFSSLHHLRVMNLGIDPHSLAPTSYSNFKALRVLTVDSDTLYDIYNHNDLKLPSNLEIVSLIYYRDPPQEDGLLASFIKSRSSSLPRLKEVAVHLNFTQGNGEDIKPEDQGPWKKDRKGLEDVTGGRIKLRKLKQGEEVGQASKGEVFLSTVLWVSN